MSFFTFYYNLTKHLFTLCGDKSRYNQVHLLWIMCISWCITQELDKMGIFPCG